MPDTFPSSSAAPAPQFLIDPLSGTSVRLEMLSQGQEIAVGSGFLWDEAGRTSLVTAWHNVTGTHPETGQTLTAGGARPDTLRASFSSRPTGQRLVRDIALYGDDGSARFRTHLTFGRLVNVVAIDIENVPSSPGVLCTSVNDLPEDPIAHRIGASAFVIGFPRGLSASGLPIWKRGTIASEPSLVDTQSGKESYLLDTPARDGMSGAPTFLFTDSGFEDERGHFQVGRGRASKFLGLYAGRIASQDQLDAQLGLVWPARLIREVVEKGIADDFTLLG